MTSIRAVQESPLVQGEDESITYNLTTTPWGSSPSGTVVKVYDITDGGETDVTSTIIPSGSPSESGDVITLPAVTAMTAGKKYRLDIKFTAGGNTLEAFCIIQAEE
jgi:hypothetical protein